MPEITGGLLADLHPNGTVRMVFIAHTCGGRMEIPCAFSPILYL